MLKKILSFCGIASFAVSFAFAQPSQGPQVKFPDGVYVGVLAGYGHATWNRLIKPPQDQPALETPIHTSERPLTYGADVGYQFSKHFAVQFNYLRFDNTTVEMPDLPPILDPWDPRIFVTKTNLYSVIFKFMLQLGDSRFRLYSDAGPAVVTRSDIYAKTTTRVSPTFGLGLNYTFNKHIMMELAFDYVDGYGKSENSPINDYIPFLYAGTFRLEYLF